VLNVQLLRFVNISGILRTFSSVGYHFTDRKVFAGCCLLLCC